MNSRNLCYIFQEKFENKYRNDNKYGNDKKYCRVRDHCHYTVE